MEYLSTYGWALIIIAVLLVIIFQIKFLAPKPTALPGSCQVVRPLGEYTTSYMKTEGLCSGYLPQSVLNLGLSLNYFSSGNNGNGNGGGGGGKGGGGVSYPSYISVNNPVRFTTDSFTIATWIYYVGSSATHCEGIIGSPPEPANGFQLFAYGGNNGACGPLWINGSYVKWPAGNLNNEFALNKWQFIVATYDGSTGAADIYVNGTLYANSIGTPRTFLPINSLMLGAVKWNNGDVYPFNGLLANVQLYNASLSKPEVDALYGEGVGGIPIQLENLIGWWPLNSNANDYSGNGNNGQLVNVTFATIYPSP